MEENSIKADENNDDFLRIGVLTSPHGVRGEISIYPTSDDLGRYKLLKECFLKRDNLYEPVTVVGCKFKKGMPVLLFKEYQNRNLIEGLRGTELYVDREHAIDLEEGEIFLQDMIGFDVYIKGKGKIGYIEDYMKNQADQTIFIIKLESGENAYIVDIPDFVAEVDTVNNKIFLNDIPGML